MSGKTPHIVRTALQNRQKVILSGSVANVQRVSPTVKGLLLKVDGSDKCEFKAGQWLDLFVPGIFHIGGFSMCSPPHEFTDKGTLSLAIKQSPDPVAQWVHEKCNVGAPVRFRFGGDFYYDPETDPENHAICLIAGGVGANPLISILRETLHHDTRNGIKRPIVLLQTARSEEELLFKEETKILAQNNARFFRSIFVTSPCQNPEIKNQRISETDLRESIKKCGKNAKYFLCGPPEMIDRVAGTLSNLGTPREDIFFEKWT